MSITGIIFNQQKVVFNNPIVPGSNPLLNFGQGVLQNISNTLQGGLVGDTAGIVIDATLTENHIMTAEVTQYPVENNPSDTNSPSTISDHVQLKSRIYQMTGVITDTPIGFLVLGQIENTIEAVLSYFGHSRSTQYYYQLVKLFESRSPFTVTSNLQRYPNMIFTNLTVDKDVDTANEINFHATLQQVNIVTSQSISAKGQNLAHSVQQTAQATSNQGQNVTDPAPDTDENATKLLQFWDGSAHATEGIFK